MKRTIQLRAVLVVASLGLLLGLTQAWAQTCSSSSEMDPATRAPIDSTVQRYFQAAQQGGAGLQANAEFNLDDLIDNNKSLFAGQPAIKSTYLLDNSRPADQRPEFFCGIYNSPDRVGFVFNSMPPGKYAVVIQDVSGKTPGAIAWIMHQSAGEWRLAGLYPKASDVAGHNGDWYLAQARAYRGKGKLHNAYFYYLIANDILRPFPAMSTPDLDKLYDEIQQARPRDLPGNTPLDMAAGGRIFKVTDMFAAPVGDTVDLVVKYQSPDISDSARTFQDNMTVIKALVTKYPEFREAFGGVVARAVAPNGQDYGSLLAMKDVK
jgi:hypothetical protein